MEADRLAATALEVYLSAERSGRTIQKRLEAVLDGAAPVIRADERARLRHVIVPRSIVVDRPRWLPGCGEVGVVLLDDLLLLLDDPKQEAPSVVSFENTAYVRCGSIDRRIAVRSAGFDEDGHLHMELDEADYFEEAPMPTSTVTIRTERGDIDLPADRVSRDDDGLTVFHDSQEIAWFAPGEYKGYVWVTAVDRVVTETSA